MDMRVFTVVLAFLGLMLRNGVLSIASTTGLKQQLRIDSSITCLACRQMCLTCQFQAAVISYKEAKGKECITAPLNWTGGEIRMKCPGKCTINARYDLTTLTPTFFHRGCQPSTAGDADNGCTKTATWYDCFYACEGDNYCNSNTGFDNIKDIKEKKKKDKEAGNNESGEDITTSLYCLMALTAVCATGYFFKKRYCTPPDDDLEMEEAVANHINMTKY